MKINIRKTNHSKRKKNKKSQCLYVYNNKNEFKRVILTGDKKLINDNVHLESLHTLIHYIGEGTYFEMINPKNWITYYNRYINYNPIYSIQIEISNVKGTPKLIFEDTSIIYDVENVKLEDKEYCRVNLIEYDINLYLPINIEIVTNNQI